MSACHEHDVAAELSKVLGITFEGKKYYLDTWGEVDDYAVLGPDRFLFLEVETSQPHPHNNVIKVWPYLEEHTNISVVLLQTFFVSSRGHSSNRGRLGSWIGKRMQSSLSGRFWYQRLVVAEGTCIITDGLKDLQAIPIKLHGLRSEKKQKAPPQGRA